MVFITPCAAHVYPPPPNSLPLFSCLFVYPVLPRWPFSYWYHKSLSLAMAHHSESTPLSVSSALTLRPLSQLGKSCHHMNWHHNKFILPTLVWPSATPVKSFMYSEFLYHRHFRIFWILSCSIPWVLFSTMYHICYFTVMLILSHENYSCDHSLSCLHLPLWKRYLFTFQVNFPLSPGSYHLSLPPQEIWSSSSLLFLYLQPLLYLLLFPFTIANYPSLLPRQLMLIENHIPLTSPLANTLCSLHLQTIWEHTWLLLTPLLHHLLFPPSATAWLLPWLLHTRPWSGKTKWICLWPIFLDLSTVSDALCTSCLLKFLFPLLLEQYVFPLFQFNIHFFLFPFQVNDSNNSKYFLSIHYLPCCMIKFSIYLFTWYIQPRR